ncbi:MAG: hypothetical protein LBB48_02720 [Treponema sp.]|jgi:hypothetical protein|nr:hypothetical protein [Treponema sp.]
MLPLIIAGAIGLLGIIFIAFLEWDRIKNFIVNLKNRLRGIRPLKKTDKAFSYMQKDFKSGNYETVYGMFDDKEELIDGEHIQSEDVDDTIAKLHRNSALIIHG